MTAMILLFLSKPSFTAIAFDSGGVATGPMTVTFIMAMAVGAADAIEGRDAVADGFGLIALVALAPIIMIMLIGFLYPADDQDSSEPDNGSIKEEESEPDENENPQLKTNRARKKESAEKEFVDEKKDRALKEPVEEKDFTGNTNNEEEIQDETTPKT